MPCGAGSLSIELDVFHPDHAKALHHNGVSNRLNLPRPEPLRVYRQDGRDIVTCLDEWIAEGLIDTIPEDDVSFPARRVERAGVTGSR